MASLNFDINDVKPLLSSLGLGQAPPPPPDTSQITPPPMPKGPTPAAAGFGEWAADPQNQQKVLDGVTPPGKPLLPPPNLGANVPLAPGAGQMAAVNPPAQPNFLTPPTMPSAPPAMIAPQSPNVGPQSLQTWEQQNPDKVASPQLVGQGLKGFLKFGIPAALISAGSGLSDMGRGNPTAGLSLIGDQAARDRSAPDINQSRYNAEVLQPMKDNLAMRDTQSQIAQRNASANKSNAQADAVPDNVKQKQQATLAQLAKNGQKGTYDEQGNLTITDDPTSEAYQSRKVQDDVRQSKKELQDAQTAFTNAKGDPNSLLFRQTQQRLVTAQQNANAAGLRAKAYWGNYLKGAYNVGLDNEVLPGAPQI